MDRRVLALMVGASVLLTVVLMFVLRSRTPPPRAERPDLRRALEWDRVRPRLAEAEPLLDLPEAELMGDVVPFRSRSLEPLRNPGPLPLLPDVGSSAGLSELGAAEAVPVDGRSGGGYLGAETAPGLPAGKEQDAAGTE